MRLTGRSEAEVQLVERYSKEQGLFRTDDTPTPKFTKTLRSTWARSSRAWPAQSDRKIASLCTNEEDIPQRAAAPVNERGFALDDRAVARHATVPTTAHSTEIGHGAVVIAAITSCTNTSNPSVMVAAGLLAKKAVGTGLKRQAVRQNEPGPGIARRDRLSRKAAGLTEPLRQSVSTPSATAARHASATAGRCPRRWPRR